MSRLNDLIRQVGLKDETLAADLQREVAALADRRWFGLNFERHVPEVVERRCSAAPTCRALERDLDL